MHPLRRAGPRVCGGEAAPRGTGPHYSPGAERALGAFETGKGEAPDGNDTSFFPPLMEGRRFPSALEFDL